MRRFTIAAVAVATALAVTACQLGGGGDEPDLTLAMPSDTYDTCAGGGVLSGGASFLSGGGGGDGAVRLGMTECGLISAIGQPDQATPGVRPGAQRVATLTYRNPDGTGTAYVFVDNALKEINRVQEAPPAATVN